MLQKWYDTKVRQILFNPNSPTKSVPNQCQQEKARSGLLSLFSRNPLPLIHTGSTGPPLPEVLLIVFCAHITDHCHLLFITCGVPGQQAETVWQNIR